MRDRPAIKSENMSEQHLPEELHKPRKLEKRKVNSCFKENICGVDLADMQLMCKYNKGFRFYYKSSYLIYIKYTMGHFFKKKKKVL